jgi:hypothetical protein
MPPKKSAKQVLKEQREALKTQLALIEKNMKSETTTSDDGETTSPNSVDSLFDAALGLELWLRSNSKAFPADAVKQKVERLGDICKMCADGTLNGEEAYWELAGLYTIVHRESSRKELNLARPDFIFPSDSLSLPSLPPNDTLTREEVEEVLGYSLDELPTKLRELEELEEATRRAAAA